jgi:YbbR domain-containing protein
MAWHPFRNLSLKIGALALGTLLWFTVSGRQTERRLSVPVSYSNIVAPLELTGDRLDSVSVNVRGAESVVSAIREGDLRVVVNLAGAHPGPNIMALGPDEVVAPLGVEVIQIEPGTVTVSLERAGQMNIAVRPTIDGTPAEGFVVRSTRVEPRTVTVAGPESRLRESITVITERIVLDGQRANVVRDVGVGVADAQLRVLPPHTVRVTVEIGPAKGDR